MELTEKYLWVEKYRPKKIEEMVLTDQYKPIFEQYITQKEIPHLLLYGPPGSGKTTIARILVDYILSDRNSLLALNGSSSTGIDTVRNNIEEFLKTPSFGKDKIKVVFIDEADYLSSNAQAALRNIIEKYQDHGRFLFTCNYIHKISDALQSRFGQSFEFKRLPKEYIKDFCINLLNNEKIQFDPISVDKVISVHYPDVRKIINLLQSRSSDNVLQVRGHDMESKEKLFRSFLTEIFVGMKNNNGQVVNSSVAKMQKLLANTELDYISIYQDLFMDDSIPIWSKIVINKYANNHMSAMIPPLHLMSCVYEVIKMGKQIRNLKK